MQGMVIVQSVDSLCNLDRYADQVIGQKALTARSLLTVFVTMNGVQVLVRADQIRVQKALTERSLLAVFGTMTGVQVLVCRPDDGAESSLCQVHL